MHQQDFPCEGFTLGEFLAKWSIISPRCCTRPRGHLYRKTSTPPPAILRAKAILFPGQALVAPAIRSTHSGAPHTLPSLCFQLGVGRQKSIAQKGARQGGGGS